MRQCTGGGRQCSSQEDFPERWKEEVNNLSLLLNNLQQSQRQQNEKFGRQLGELQDHQREFAIDRSAAMNRLLRCQQDWEKKSEARMATFEEISTQPSKNAATSQAMLPPSQAMEERVTKLEHSIGKNELEARFAKVEERMNEAFPHKEIVASLQEEVRRLGVEVQLLRGLPEVSNAEKQIVAQAENMSFEQCGVEARPGSGMTPMSKMVNAGSMEPGVFRNAASQSASTGTEILQKNSNSSLPAAPLQAILCSRDQLKSNKVVAKEHLEVTIGQNLWEVVALLGAPQYSTAASVLVAIMHLLNLVLQILFCAAASAVMTENDVDEVKQSEYMQWRVSAHRVESLLRTSGETLVQRVCDLDASLSTATQQYFLRDTISKYLQTSAYTFDIPAGALVCMLALMIWYFRVAKEVLELWEFFLAVRHTPTGRFEVKTMEDGSYQLLFLDTRRKIACLITTVSRAIVGYFLVDIGTRAIAYTDSVSDLLLSALTLELIVDLDEYLFDVTIPERVQQVLVNLCPVKVSFREVQGLGPKTFCWISVVPLALALAGVFIVKPHLDDIRAVNDILCSGDRQFAYATDISGFPHATYDFIDSVGGVDVEAMIQWEMDAVTLAAVKGVSHTSASNMFIWDENLKELDEAVALRDMSQLLDTIQSTCEDLLTFRACNETNRCQHNAPESFRRFATLAKKVPITTCSQWAEMGDCTSFNPTFTSLSDSAVTTRKICPAACGCLLNPPSPFRTVSCPASCTVKRNSNECKDVPAQEMHSLQQFQFLQDDMQGIREAEQILTLPEDLKILGCDLVAVWNDPYHHTSHLPPCNEQALLANLLSCLTVRCQDYDQALCQKAVLHEGACQSSMPRANLSKDFPFTPGGTELQISRICPQTCKTCPELPYCVLPPVGSDAIRRMETQDFYAVFHRAINPHTGSNAPVQPKWNEFLRGLCPSTCQCDRVFADGCPTPCFPGCDETTRPPGSSGYRGCQAFTQSGRRCQNWAAQVPHEHRYSHMGDHSYCRSAGEHYVWCYTVDPEVRYEHCDPLQNM